MDDNKLNVEFDADEAFSEGEKKEKRREGKGLVGILMRIGIAKTETAGSLILVIFSLVLLGISGFIFVDELVLDTLPPPQEELDRIQELTPSS